MAASSPPRAWLFVVGAVVNFLRLFGWRWHTEIAPDLPPGSSPAVVVFNHTSNIDPFIVADQMWRTTGHWVQPLAKKELFDVPGLGRLGRAAGGISVHRGTGEGRQQAFGEAIEVLHDGGTVLLAPEGTITHDGSLLPLRHGAARLALDADVPVIVVTHFGAQRAFSPVVRFPDRGAHVSLHVDALEPIAGESADELTGRIAATMIDRHARLVTSYPQRDTSAAWWPPYQDPATPSATAREHMDQYRETMREAVESARERMTALTEERAVTTRVEAAKHRAELLAAELAESAARRSSRRADGLHALSEQMRARANEGSHDDVPADDAEA